MFSKVCLICGNPHNNKKYCSRACTNTATKKGTVLTENHRTKIAKSMQGKNKSKENPFYSKCHSKKTRKYIGDCQRGEKHHYYTEKNTLFKANGYIKINIREEHPFLRKGIMSYHRFVMANRLGRKLLKTEVVHHKDCNPLNNDIKNLMLFKNKSEHNKYHAKFNRIAAKLLGNKTAKELIQTYHILEKE